MSMWSNLLSWALKMAKSELQQNGLTELQQATNALSQVVQKHAPDMAPVIDPLIQQAISSAVAGIMTKSS